MLLGCLEENELLVAENVQTEAGQLFVVLSTSGVPCPVLGTVPQQRGRYPQDLDFWSLPLDTYLEVQGFPAGRSFSYRSGSGLVEWCRVWASAV